MKNLLNLGMSDPLTLGMAHPIADRLETLGCAKVLTKGGRATVLTVLGGLVVFSAPFTVAADNKAVEKKLQSGVVSSLGDIGVMSSLSDITYHSYEITEKNGEKRAFVISEDGTREPIELEKGKHGTYRLTSSDGKIINIPNVDEMGLAGLSKLEGLKSLRAIEALKGLENLDGLTALEGLKNLEGIEFSGKDIEIFTLDGDEINLSENANLWESFPEKMRDMLTSKDGSKRNKIVHTGDSYRWIEYEGDSPDSLDLADTIVDLNVDFLRSSDPLESAQRQLDIAKRQLQSLANDDNISFDLKNALRDIENAQKSLLEAESRMIEDDE